MESPRTPRIRVPRRFLVRRSAGERIFIVVRHIGREDIASRHHPHGSNRCVNSS